MFKLKFMREQLIEERRKNASLTAALAKANADIEYVAMMTDVEMESENEEMEVSGNGEI